MKTKLTQVKSPVSEALILVCEKCGKNMGFSEDNNPARALQKLMKETIKAEGKKGVQRAVITGCMDICPKDELAICISRTDQADEYLTVTGDVKELADTILAKV